MGDYGIFFLFLMSNYRFGMINLIETYECKADAKGRVAMPMAFRKQLAEVLEDGFVLKRSVFESCLDLYPKKEWDVMMQKVGTLNRFNRKVDKFVRQLTAGLKKVELDSTARFLIPKDLLIFSGISKNIVLIGQGDKIEVWDKNKYEAFINDDEDFGDLAEEVMGNLNFNDDVS